MSTAVDASNFEDLVDASRKSVKHTSKKHNYFAQMVSPCPPAATPLYTTEENAALAVFTQLGAWASLLGSLVIIVSWSLFAVVRSGGGSGGHHGRLIVALSVANLGCALGKMYSVGQDAAIDACPAAWCVFTGAWVQFFECANIAWICVISFNTLETFTLKRSSLIKSSQFWSGSSASGAWTREVVEHVWAWGFAVLLTVGPALTDAYGDAGNWCWMPPAKRAERIAFYYFWLIVSMIWVVFCVAGAGVAMCIITRNRDTGAVDLSRAQLARQARLIAYALTFVLLNVPSVVHRFTELGGNHVYFLALLQAFFSPPKGLVNALVYGVHPLFLRTWRNAVLGSPDGAVARCDFWEGVICCVWRSRARAAANGRQVEDGMVTLTDEFGASVANDADAAEEEAVSAGDAL